MIWVWNGPSFMLSFMKMDLSISRSCEASDVVAPSSPGVLLASPNSGAAVPHQHNKCKAHAIVQEVENWSSSLSLMTLTILPSVHVPITRGMHLENSDSSGTTRKMMSSSYPTISLTWTCKVTKPRSLVLVPPNPIKFRGYSTRSPSGRTGNSH